MRSRLGLVFVLAWSCHAPPTGDQLRSIPSTPIASTGSFVRRVLAAPGTTWHSFEAAHVRIHIASPIPIERAGALADSIERARGAALASLGEDEIAGERPLEVILVATRDDMQRLAGRPVGGAGFPEELAAILVAGDDYRPFFRHELTHAYAGHRWGKRQSGAWLDEGLAARATGPCQGHSVDAVVAGYIASGVSPSLDALAGDFYAIPELPGYFTAASLADFIQRRDGIGALREIWRGERPGADGSHPLGNDTERLWSEWRHQLASVTPATLDTARLRRDGC